MKTSKVTVYLDSDSTINVIDSENELLPSYLANYRAIINGTLTDWSRLYPATDFEDIQHIPALRSFCTKPPEDKLNKPFGQYPEEFPSIVCHFQAVLAKAPSRYTCQICSYLSPSLSENKARDILARVLRICAILANKALRSGSYRAYSINKIFDILITRSRPMSTTRRITSRPPSCCIL
jgi:hypothetical protein